jgi:hypothetical protein
MGNRASAGSHVVVWDGRDEGGATVPSGIYFARLRFDEGERLVKLVCSQ